MACPHGDAEMPDRARCGIECRTPLTTQSPAPPSMPAPAPLQYLRKGLAENILTFKVMLEGERTQVTVGFTNL